MSLLADLASAAAGIVTIAVALVLMKHAGHLPGAAHPWVSRLNIVLMYAGGSVIAVSGAEGWLAGAASAVSGWVGPYAGLVTSALVIVSLFLIAGTAVALIWAPADGAAMVALAVPLVLGLVAGGFIHQFYVATTVPAQSLATALHAWLAG